MNLEVMDQLLPIIVMLLIMTAFFLFLFIKIPTNYGLKFLGIPILMIVSTFSVMKLTDVMGHAYPGYPPYGFVLLQYQVVGVDPDTSKLKIEIYAKSKKGTRLYSIPYSRQAEIELEQAMEKFTKTGLRQVGEWRDGYGMGNLRFTPLTPSEISPKK